MIFVIINKTDRVIPITRTNMEKVNLEPHKPYVLETVHNPEIRFWQNCTDGRFAIISDTVSIERYLRVLSNQEKNNTAKTETKQTQAVTNINNDVAVNTKEENINKTIYTEAQLMALKVADLKTILTSMNVTIPNTNKAGLVELILNNQ